MKNSLIVKWLCLGMLGVFMCAMLYDKYYPSSADLTEVRQRVVPELREALLRDGLSLGSPLYIRIFKASSELEVWIQDGEQYRLFKTYPICSYSGDLGPKLKEGDKQSPEGFYAVGQEQMNPDSSYHLSFNLGFPNSYDRAHGRTGSFLMVHGRCVSIGCYAMTDPFIEEIYLLMEAAFDKGQEQVPVHIFPFRMAEGWESRYSHYEWLAFWQELAPIYIQFEATKVPPKVFYSNSAYTIE